VQQASVEKGGGKQGERKGESRGFLKDFPVKDLIRNRSPAKDEPLTLHNIQRGLVEEYQGVHQDEPDGNDGESGCGIVVFERKKQGLVPSFTLTGKIKSSFCKVVKEIPLDL